MKVKNSGGGDFENPEPGTYGATCFKVVDLGTQTDEYKGKTSRKRQVMIGWELEHFMQDGRPFAVQGLYTASLNEKAKLRGVLESWRGVAFQEQALAEGFDLRKVLGAPCLLTVITTPTGKSKVGSVIKLPKGMQKPDASNAHIYFSLDEFNQEIFEGLSEWTQNKIAQSPEYQKLMQAPQARSAAATAATGKNVDDIPF